MCKRQGRGATLIHGVEMPYYVYVLANPEGRIYIGQTDNVVLRLGRHNAGLVRSTKAHRPWQILLAEEYATRSEAMVREKALKSGQGRAHIRSILGSSIGPP